MHFGKQQPSSAVTGKLGTVIGCKKIVRWLALSIKWDSNMLNVASHNVLHKLGDMHAESLTCKVEPGHSFVVE